LFGQHPQAGNQPVRGGQHIDQVTMPLASGSGADGDAPGRPEQPDADQRGQSQYGGSGKVCWR